MITILINTGNEVKVQAYAPQIKGLNLSFACPKENEIKIVGDVKIRRASNLDAKIIQKLTHNPTAQILYFNTL